MAYLGLVYPWIGALTRTAGTYEKAFKCGSAVGVTVTPNYASGSQAGDNHTVLTESKFTNATIALTVTNLPVDAASVVFGHTVSTETGSTGAITYGTEDTAPYCGFGYIANKKDDAGAETFEASFLPKVQFSEDAVAYTTRGDSITFTTPSLTGTAIADDSGNWKYVQSFATEALALAWLKGKLSVSTT